MIDLFGSAGNCWITLLHNFSLRKTRLLGDFLIKMVSLEIASYLKHVYQVKGVREPINYSYLPAISFVRTIGTYIKDNVNKWLTSAIFPNLKIICFSLDSQMDGSHQ